MVGFCKSNQHLQKYLTIYTKQQLITFNNLEECYVFDGYCGANPISQKKIRFVHELAWQQHFVTNMFIRPETKEELKEFEPDFTIINACSKTNLDWKKHNLNFRCSNRI